MWAHFKAFSPQFLGFLPPGGNAATAGVGLPLNPSSVACHSLLHLQGRAHFLFVCLLLSLVFTLLLCRHPSEAGRGFGSEFWVNSVDFRALRILSAIRFIHTCGLKSQVSTCVPIQCIRMKLHCHLPALGNKSSPE